MPESNPDLKKNVHGSAIAVRVIPRAKKDEFAQIMKDGTVKIRLAAPPVEGKANQALIRFLAQTLGVSQSKIEIVAGGTGRNKLISIIGLEPDQVQEKIMEQLAK